MKRHYGFLIMLIDMMFLRLTFVYNDINVTDHMAALFGFVATMVIIENAWYVITFRKRKAQKTK